MTTLGEFLGLVDVDGERLDTKDDGGDHDKNMMKIISMKTDSRVKTEAES